MQKTQPGARTMTTIGFIGLGSMGAPLAGRLLQENRVYGTNRTRASALIRQGLIWRDSPREVAASAQVAFSEGVLLAERGAASALGEPAVNTAGAGPRAA